MKIPALTMLLIIVFFNNCVYKSQKQTGNNEQLQTDTLLFYPDSLKVGENDSVKSILFYKFHEQLEENDIYITKYVFTGYPDIDLYNYNRPRECFTPETDIGRNDYFIFGNQRFVFDSLKYYLSNRSEVLERYAQSPEFTNVYLFDYVNQKYLAISVVDMFVMGSFQRNDLYLFAEFKLQMQLYC